MNVILRYIEVHQILLLSEDGILSCFGDTEFDHFFDWYLNRFSGGRILPIRAFCEMITSLPRPERVNAPCHSPFPLDLFEF